MSEEERQVNQGEKSSYIEQPKGDIFIQYGEKKIPRALTPAPILSDCFIGREDDLKEVYQKLFHGQKENLLLLVNGDGGFGKTTFASHYYDRYSEKYIHRAWVFAESGVVDAMLTLAPNLGVTFEPTMPGEERLEKLIAEMSKLEKPGLLVLDNANNVEDLEKHYGALRRCPNFHLLLTTRVTKLEQAQCHPIKPLTMENAALLFKTHFTAHKKSEDELLKDIIEAVGRNTLVIELLAKNLNHFNTDLKTRYYLADLLKDLQKCGVLALPQTKEVRTDYLSLAQKNTSSALRQETPEKIVAAMYNLSDLQENEGETELMSIFSVLPAETIGYNTLEKLLPGDEQLDLRLKSLSKKGWLDYNEHEQSFKCSPVIQEITRLQNKARLWEDVEPVVIALNDLLEYEPGTGHLMNVSYEQGGIITRYGERVIQCLEEPRYEICILAERLGSYFRTTGNLAKALEYFEQYKQLSKEMYDADSENVNFIHGLAISYEKLGVTQLSLGNLEKALEYFQDEAKLFEELQDADSENADFKNGLAISYLKLGDAHRSLGNLEKALQYFQDETKLFEELHDAHSENLSFKNGLAISYEKLGVTYQSLGNLDKALEYFQDETKLFEELYGAYHDNVSFKNGLTISYSKLGGTHQSLGDIDKTLEFYEKDMQLSKELYQSYPENVSFKNGLAISYIKLGNLYQEKKQNTKAKGVFQSAKQILTELVNISPGHADYRRNLDWVENQISVI
ncbi:MAG: tetratricopeptide repeat protein [Leptospirales bacterium]